MSRLETLSHAALIVIGAVALFAALHQLSDIFAPLALALVTGVVLSPVSDFCDRHHLPRALAAVTILVLTLMLLAALGMIFQPAAEHLANQAPKVLRDMRDAMASMRSVVRGMMEVTDNVTKAISPDAKSAADGAKAAKDSGVEMPSITGALMMAPALLGEAMVFAGSLFFFLLTRADIYDWAARRLVSPSERGRMVQKMRKGERRVSRYFLTIALINAALGVTTAVALQIVELPQAMTWGLIAFVLNFVPYLGPGLGIVGMLYAGVAAFDGVVAGVPAAAYVLIIAIESQFVTPALVGRNVAMNPLLVFLALIFGFWLWGPIGGIVAIPLLLWVLVLSGTLPDPAQSAGRASHPPEAEEAAESG